MPKFNSFVYDVSAASLPCVISGVCYAQFRLSPEYKEEGAPFGFDWLRIGDATEFVRHDIPYKSCVGQNYKDHQRNYPDAVDDTDLIFVEDEYMYKSLCHSYTPGTIYIFPSSQGGLEQYHTPVLTIYPCNSSNPAKLVLEIRIIQKQEQLHLSYDKEFIEIKGADSLSCEPGQYQYDIEVICKKEFNKEMYVYLLSNDSEKEKLSGILRIWRNDKAFRKKINVLLVNIKFLSSEDDTSIPLTGNTEDVIASLNKFLPHALIKPTIEHIEFDLGYVKTLGKRLVEHEGSFFILASEDTSKPIDRYFISVLKDKGVDFSQYNTIIFCLGVILCALGADGRMTRWEGYAAEKSIILGQNSDLITPVHECLHTLGLAHAFNNFDMFNDPQEFTYKVFSTDNLMDYSHMNDIKIVNWWEWQWKKARQMATPEE